MTTAGIPMDKAELLSVLLEAIFYGFSLLMFGTTIWTLVFRRSSDQVNRQMFVVTCALWICSTAHLVGHIIRVMDGLILYRNTFPGGPAAYFGDIAQWTFNFKNYIYIVQMLIGDGVVLYRCYVVWQSKLVMIMPVLLWCAAGSTCRMLGAIKIVDEVFEVTGFVSCYLSSIATRPGVFDGAVSRWIVSFWATSLSMNLLATLLLVCRIWSVDRRARGLRDHQPSQLRPILRTIVDAGVIYSLTLLASLVCFLARSNMQYVVLDMVTPIISITFYMVIIRVGLATRGIRVPSIPLGNSLEQSLSAERRRRVQIQIQKLTEVEVESGRRSRQMEMKHGAGDVDRMMDEMRHIY